MVAPNFVVAPGCPGDVAERGRKRVLRLPEKVSSPRRWGGDRPAVRERSRASAELVAEHIWYIFQIWKVLYCNIVRRDSRLVMLLRYSGSDFVESFLSFRIQMKSDFLSCIATHSSVPRVSASSPSVATLM